MLSPRQESNFTLVEIVFFKLKPQKNRIILSNESILQQNEGREEIYE